ncbi:MAG: NUDIX hydrolase, partial [Candidatus Moranbacteria bacterium]|nr:NUDIX hydrolase [Candidatus Moranbacteria bacterium]
MDTKAKIGVIVADKEGRVLLVKEKLEKKPVALWNIIKGSYDGGETIFEAAKRECWEEVSLNVELIQ